MNRTSNGLPVEWNHLKTAHGRGAADIAEIGCPAFAELVGPLPQSLPECIIELDGRRGRLRIQLKNPSASYLAAVGHNLPEWALCSRSRPSCVPWLRLKPSTPGRVSTLWRNFAARNSEPTRFPGCLFLFPSRSRQAIRILAYEGQEFRIATKRLSKSRFPWWPTGSEPARTLRAHHAQLPLAAGNPDTEAAKVWRQVSA